MLQLLQHKPLWSSAWLLKGLLSAVVQPSIDARYALMAAMMVGCATYNTNPVLHVRASNATRTK